jgi:hypothetical protein
VSASLSGRQRLRPSHAHDGQDAVYGLDISRAGQLQMLGTIFRGQPMGMLGSMSGGRNGCERCR